MELPEKIIKLRSLNPHIVCLLCAGYFVEATTIVECLHTFCKSCIVRYLQSSKFCPTCGILVHETEPLSNIKIDRTMQDIMEKILPNLRAREKKSEEEFMENLRKKERKKEENIIRTVKSHIDLTYFPHTYRYNEQFNLCFELDRNGEMWLDDMKVVELHGKYIRCPGRAKILHLKKFIRRFYEPYCSKFEIKVKCNNHELDDNDHLRLIYVIYWKKYPQPIVLYYGFKKWDKEVNMLLDDCISKIESDEGRNWNDLKTNVTMKSDEPVIGLTNCNNEDEMLGDCISKLDSCEATHSDEITDEIMKVVQNETVDHKCNRSCEVITSNIPGTDEQEKKIYCDVSPADMSFPNSNHIGHFTGGSLKLCKQSRRVVCDNLELSATNKATVKSIDSFKSFNGGIVTNSLLFTSNHACLTVT